MSSKYYNCEYFWRNNKNEFQRKNIIIDKNPLSINDLPISLTEDEDPYSQKREINNRLFYLHPYYMIKSPISGITNHFYVLCFPYMDYKMETPFYDYDNYPTNNSIPTIPFQTTFSIRQKIKCKLPENSNSFYIQKLIDEIIFILLRADIIVKQIYFNKTIDTLIYFIEVQDLNMIFKTDLMTKYLLEKILLKNGTIPKYEPEILMIKDTTYLWSIQFYIPPKYFSEIKENLISVFQTKNGYNINKETKYNNENNSSSEYITIKSNYFISDFINIFLNLNDDKEQIL